MRLFGRQRAYVQFLEGPPCERCDHVGDSKPFRGFPVQLDVFAEGVGHVQHGDFVDFDDLYPRPLMLCGGCRIAHLRWFERRRFVRVAAPGRSMLVAAKTGGVLNGRPVLQLVGTPAKIWEADDILAMALVAAESMESAACVVTRVSFETNRGKLLDVVRWTRNWQRRHASRS